MQPARVAPADPPRSFLVDNALSLALTTIFLACVAAQALTGVAAYNSDLGDAGLPTVSLPRYLVTGDFLDGIFSNWQAALLQLAVLVSLGAKLRQRGSPHSLRTPQERRRQGVAPQTAPPSPWAWANSLTLAFLAGGLLALGAHAWFGLLKHNEEQGMRHLPHEGLGAYVASPDFWRSVFQCWEAEVFALIAFVLLTVFLRQENSPESKPVEASADDTGETDA